jgi:chorismate synthase
MSLFRLRFQSAGESHGPALVTILDGLPAGLGVDPAFVDRELARRQAGYGRGGRMKIEKDRADFLGGVRAGKTLGSPVAIRIANLDAATWQGVMSPFDSDAAAAGKRRISAPRPGHADLAGALKWNTRDLRDVLERASARETASRVAAGALAKLLLRETGVEVRSGVLGIGGVGAGTADPVPVDFDLLPGPDDDSPLRLVDRALEPAAIEAVDAAFRDGDTLGGTLVVAARGLPPGLGSAFAWDRKLDGRLAQALLSIPAVKGLGFGDGLAGCRHRGSQVHDPIGWETGRGFTRPSNRAGGLEGGMTNGEPVVALLAMKPIATLRAGLPSVEIDTKEPARSDYERSDVTALPACGVIAEAMMALVLADALLEKCGGDTVEELLRNLAGYRAQIGRY